MTDEQNKSVIDNIKLTTYAAVPAASRASLKGHATADRDIEDLKQTAALELIRNAKTHDPEIKTLCKHALRRMQKAVWDEAHKHNTVTIARGAAADSYRVLRVIKRHKDMTFEDAAKTIGYSLYRIRRARMAYDITQIAISTETVIPSKHQDIDIQIDAAIILDTLTPNNRKAIETHFGITPDYRTQKKLAMEEGTTQSVITRRVQRTLKKLRKRYRT